MSGKGALFGWPTLRMGRMTSAPASGRKARSRAAVSSGGTPGSRKATRAASHSANSAASGAPRVIGTEVQFCTAVSRKPAITAPAKPNSISCACQTVAE